jgi:hypothetical protein
MSCVILLGKRQDNEPTEFDGKFVKAYDPTYVDWLYGYDGGVLEVTEDPAEALQFNSTFDAWNYWRQPGIEVDGLPARPLTDWVITFCITKDAKGTEDDVTTRFHGDEPPGAPAHPR